MTQELLTTLLPIAIVILLRAWNSGAIQASVGKLIPRLPKWAQWIPPVALSVGSTVVIWLVQGVGTQEIGDTLAQGGTSGLVSVGLWHVAKRVIPLAAVGAVRSAASKSGLSMLFVLVLLGGSQACSGSPPQLPTMPVCAIPSSYLERLPDPAVVTGAVQDVQEVMEVAQEQAKSPDAAGLILLAQMAVSTVDPICVELGSEPCTEALTKAKDALSKADVTREQVCGVVALLVAVIPVERVPAELSAARELCR